MTNWEWRELWFLFEGSIQEKYKWIAKNTPISNSSTLFVVLFTSFLHESFCFVCLLSLSINQNAFVDSKNEIGIPKNSDSFREFWKYVSLTLDLWEQMQFSKKKEGQCSKQSHKIHKERGSQNSNSNSKQTFTLRVVFFFLFSFFFHPKKDRIQNSKSTNPQCQQ